MPRSWAILLLLGTVLLVGCKQKLGEKCQLNSDCADTFICCVKADPTARTGVCILPEACASVADAAVGDAKATDQKVELPGDKTVGPSREKLPADKTPVTPDKPPVTPDKPPVDKAPVDKAPVTPDKPPTQ